MDRPAGPRPMTAGQARAAAGVPEVYLPDPIIGTPPRLRRPGRPVPIVVETPDLVADLATILDDLRASGPWESVDLLNRLAEFGWQIVRMPD